jgi:hypothetical protein
MVRFLARYSDRMRSNPIIARNQGGNTRSFRSPRDKRLLSYSVRLLKTTFRHWLEDKAPQLGAALAYYTVFSLRAHGARALSCF